MKKPGILSAIILILVLVVMLAVPVAAKSSCLTITKGEIFYSPSHYLAGHAIPTGFDAYGYNYQGHMFSGSYFNSYAGGYGFPVWEGNDEAYLAANPLAANNWAWPYRDVNIIMKWNDAWISNKSYDGDKFLDRHPGYSSYIGSGAWLTNHQSGEYEDGSNWNYFVKIVAAPADAKIIAGNWYTANGMEIGYDIWGEFAVIQEVSNDQYTGDHGLIYNAPAPTGFGYYQP